MTFETATKPMLPPRRLSQLLLVSSSVLALLLCPHSKVEESFPLQATHDVFFYGLAPLLQASADNDIATLPYDHLKYPGVVPRTFMGPVVIAYIARCLGYIAMPSFLFDLWGHPMVAQFLCRFLLLTFHLHAWFRLANAVTHYTNTLTGNYLLIITACQFHIPFYGSRMLPNIFALILVIHSYADWFHGNIRRAAIFLIVATGVFRCDILLLLFTVGLTWLITRQIGTLEAIKLGLMTGIISLVVTVPIDSLLWQRLLWPEGEVFWFNTVLGKSSDWGTSPWHWYISSALPKSMLLTAMLVPLCFLRIPEKLVEWELKISTRSSSSRGSLPLVDTTLLPFVAPIASFVGLYSCLGHKEMRFIFPALPMLNTAAAFGLYRLHRQAFPILDKEKENHRSSVLARVAFAGGLICVLLTWVCSLAFMAVSRQNYPGGDALFLLSEHIQKNIGNTDTMHVHIDVASAMTGVSLFGQREAALSTSSQGREWTFEKAGYESENQIMNYSGFTHILSEVTNIPGFYVVDVAQGHPRLDVRHFKVATSDAIFVHERRGWMTSQKK